MMIDTPQKIPRHDALIEVADIESPSCLATLV